MKTKTFKKLFAGIGCTSLLLFGGYVFIGTDGRVPGTPNIHLPSIGATLPTGIDARESSSVQKSSPNATTTSYSRRRSMILSHQRPATIAKKESGVAIGSDGIEYPLRTYKALMIPNDPKALQSWVTNAYMDAAWDISPGPGQTTLAIIDTGVALRHEEFANRWKLNAAEQGVTTSEAPSVRNCTDRGLTLNASCNIIDDDGDGVIDNESGTVIEENPSRLNCTDQGKALTKACNNIDDDDNGFVDDVNGWDFIHFDNMPQAGESTPTTTEGEHGTYVAGVAAATANNGKGIAGVDSNTSILPLQALDDDGTGSTVAVANAITYAAARGADVISLSLGSGASDALVQQAVQEAIAAGSVVVAAAGNDGCNCLSYPANYPEVLSVGALDATNRPASFSSYGANLDVLAPGVGLYTTGWTSQNPTNTYASGINGTSLATPIVSGLLTRLKSAQPNSTPQQLVAALLENTSRMTLASNEVRNNQLGYGRLDAGAALRRLVIPHTPALSYQFTPISTGGHLSPSAPVERAGGTRVLSCPDSVMGKTAVYELNRNGDSFFTISTIERTQAIARGYTSSLFTYTCLSQVHDRPDIIRLLNINKEFRNINDDKLYH